MKLRFFLKMAKGQAVAALILAIAFNLGAFQFPPATAQELSANSDILAKLVHPEVAERLSLSDAQRARFQTLLLARSGELQAAPDEGRSAIHEKYEQLALAEMTDEQRSKLASDQPTQKLMFQFREMKWDQVLTWFAAQQDLTLVMDRIPPGSFTYSDSRSYSPAEAVDLLNSILITRGYTLVRREKMLMVTELSDTIPVELLPRVQLEQLPERGRFELVSVVFPLDGRPVDLVVNEIKPYLNSFGRVLPLSQGTQVLVIENAGKMATINELIASVKPTQPAAQASPAPGPIFSAYSIGKLVPAKTLETILKLIPSENISVDPNTGVLSAFVVPSQHTAIKTALDSMLEKQAELPEMQAVAYRLKGMDDEQFRAQVASIAPSARIMTTQERALVVASPVDHPLIRESLIALDILPVETEQEVRSFEVPTARVADIEAALKSLTPKSLVAGNAASGTLIVKGSLDDLRTASEMIEILSREDDPVQLKIYQLTEMQIRRRAIISSLPGDLSELKLQDGNTAAELLVWGTDKQHSLFGDFLLQLDQPEVPPQLPVPQVYPIEVADSALVLQLLSAEYEKAKFTLNSEATQLTVVADSKSQEAIGARLAEFHAQLPARPERTMEVYQLAGWTAAALQQAMQTELASERVQLDSQQDRLFVWAIAERHAKLRELVAALGEEPGVEKQRVAVVYSLQHVSATATKTVLDQLAKSASIVADEKTQKVIITGTLADHSVFQPIIAQMDRAKSVDETPVVQAFDVGSLQAVQILPVLQSLFPDMKLSVESTANKIIGTGTKQELLQMTEAVSRLMDSVQGKAQSVKSYPVPFGEMASLPTILSQIAPKAIISSDVTSRTITVLASEEQHLRIAEALQQVANISRGNKKAASYVVRPSQTAGVQASLRTLMPSLAITTDAVSGQVIVLASSEEHEAVADIVELLASGPNAEERTLQVFKLKPKMLASPEFLKTLQSLAPPQVTLEPSMPTDSLLAVGTPDELQTVAKRVDELLGQWPSPNELTSAVYTLKHAATSSAVVILQPLLPGVTIAQDPVSRKIAATASQEDHRKIKELIDLLDIPALSNQIARVYRLRHGVGQSLAGSLSTIMPDARLYSEASSGVLLATATEQQHDMIQKIVDEYASHDQSLETKVFSLRKADAYNLQFAVQSWNNQVKVAGDRPSNSLIVTGPSEALATIGDVIAQIDGSFQGDQVTTFYPIENANPNTLASALQQNFPKATLAGDSGGGGLFVTATEPEHTEIQKLVEQLNAQPGRLPSLKTFVVQHVTPSALASSLTEAFGSRTAARVTFSENAKSVFVLGTRDELKIAEQLVKMLDVTETMREPRKFQAFSMFGMDGRGVIEALEKAFENEPDRVDMQYDSSGGRLVVFGTDKQLARVTELVDSLMPVPRSMQVFSLGSLDALVAKEAVDSLFTDTPYYQSPTITVDQERQQLLVRATDDQIRQIRSLLTQLGAPPALLPQHSADQTTENSSRSTGDRVRIIPMPFGADNVLNEVRRTWPSLGSNPIQVIEQESGATDVPEKEPGHDAASYPAGNSGIQNASVPDEPDQSVAPQITLERPVEQELKTQELEVPSLAPPIIIVLGEKEWTVASDDVNALDQMEKLLEILRSPRLQPIVSTGNYSMYLLQRASATEMQTLLEELLRPGDTRGSRSSNSMSSLYRRIKIVADNRTNALIVSGSINDRTLIEELLGVLDSSELMGTLQQLLPTTFTLASATATQVYSILRDIYRSQLTTNVQRRSLPIPEGVSVEVSSLLQQLNAQASSPILSISTDEVTNSLIVRAPVDLTQEIRQFIERLDDQTANTPSRRVELIRLESTNTKSIEQALRRLLSK